MFPFQEIEKYPFMTFRSGAVSWVTNNRGGVREIAMTLYSASHFSLQCTLAATTLFFTNQYSNPYFYDCWSNVDFNGEKLLGILFYSRAAQGCYPGSYILIFSSPPPTPSTYLAYAYPHSPLFPHPPPILPKHRLILNLPPPISAYVRGYPRIHMNSI